MRDWKHRRIKEVFAGLDCVMAITEEGEILQKLVANRFDNKRFISSAPMFTKEINSSQEFWSLSGSDASPRVYPPGKRPTDIQQIGISHVYPGLSIGLTNCGTCRITELPRTIREVEGVKGFDTILRKVESWRSIRQVAVSDSFFALSFFAVQGVSQ